MTNPWTKMRIAELRRLWASGMTASAIAEKLDLVSRNAVLGKVARLGLPSRRDSISRSKPKRSPTAFGGIYEKKISSPGKTTEKTTGNCSEVKPAPIRANEVAPEDKNIPLHQRKTIFTLEKNNCRWPIGDPRKPDFHFCGGEIVQGLPYCVDHCRRSYVQTPVSRVGARLPQQEVRAAESEVA